MTSRDTTTTRATDLDRRQVLTCVGKAAIDRDGAKIGTIRDVYADRETGRPEWLCVGAGIFGNRTSFVPLAGAEFVGDDVAVPYDKGHVKNAPSVAADGELTEEEERRLYDHYGRSPAAGNDTRRPATTGARDDAMTRSEEELDIHKTTRPVQRARLHKWVDTEQVDITVPVRREKARVVTEPITDANRSRALDGPDLTERDHEIVLSEEQVEVEKKVVPKERVRLETEDVVEERHVRTDVAKEHIDLDGDRSAPRR